MIVEAARRSGALITADHALELGRDIHAVPGPIDRATSEGTNRLIEQGAAIVTNTDLGADSLTVRSVPAEPELRDLLAAVPAAPVTVEQVAAAAGGPADEIGTSLTILEIRGYVTTTRDGRVMRMPGRRPMMVR